MVAPTFILTRTFAISALFVGALPVTYAAPIPTEVATSSSFLDRRFCRQMGCLYALPESTTDSSSATGNSSAATSLSPSADVSSSALQVIDLLISALQSAASTIRQPSTAETVNVATDAVTPVDSATPVDALSAVIAAVANAAVSSDAADTSIPASSALESEVSSVESPKPAVEVVGFSTVESTDVDSSASV